ncbi:MAG TPA: helix-turn-helix transcriptional regulator [Actinokineospora sp.]|nr:helix-turn-helix transcriptional regulator [Actinokineospora sp.]
MINKQPARARALGFELAEARMLAGKTTIQAARGIGTSPATINRTEKANRIPQISDVAGLLGVYGVTGTDRARMLHLVESVDAPSWMETGEGLRRLLPAFAHFESRARSLLDFSPAILPGLLQTEAYARALHTAGGFTGAVQDAMVETRMDRQLVLNKLASPRYTAIIDENVLRRPQGGSEVMVQQINWLIGRAQQPHISIHVIPFRHGGYRNPGPFFLMEFAQQSPLVYVEHHGVAGFLHAPTETEEFQDLAVTLFGVALGSTETVNFLTKMVADYERS